MELVQLFYLHKVYLLEVSTLHLVEVEEVEVEEEVSFREFSFFPSFFLSCTLSELAFETDLKIFPYTRYYQ